MAEMALRLAIPIISMQRGILPLWSVSQRAIQPSVQTRNTTNLTGDRRTLKS